MRSKDKYIDWPLTETITFTIAKHFTNLMKKKITGTSFEH